MKEAQSVATQLGMDMEADSEFIWFLKQALVALLPQGWKKESDPKGRIKYHNSQTNATTATHPLLHQYRIAFFRLLLYPLSSRSGPDVSKAREKALPRSIDEDEVLFHSLVVEHRSSNPLRDAVLKDADVFYGSIVGPTATHPPHYIEETAEFQQVSPTEMLEMAHKLGIGNDFRYFWIARMALVLPLPPCFETTIDAIGHTKYLNTEHNVLLEQHPSIHYLQKLVSRLRFNPAAINSEMMFFYDKQMMPYVVDLHSLTTGHSGILLPSDQSQSTGLTKTRRNLYHEDRSMKAVIQDMMLLELTQKAGIDFAADVHLVGTVYEFMGKLREEKLLESWSFRYTVEGEHYWYHTPEERAYRRFPYTKNLKRYVKKRQKKLSSLLPSYLKPPTSRHPLFLIHGDYLFDASRSEAVDMMTSLLKHMLETNRFEMPKGDFDVEEVFRGVEGVGRETVMDALFANPFEMGGKYVRKREDKGSLNVSTDSEIFTEAGFKLEGDKIIFVLDDKPKAEKREQTNKSKTQQKARIVQRRKGKVNTVKLGPESMLPFQVQVGRILARMNTAKPVSEVPSESSDSSSFSSLSAEEEDKVPSLPVGPLPSADPNTLENLLNSLSPSHTTVRKDSNSLPRSISTVSLSPVKPAEAGETMKSPSHNREKTAEIAHTPLYKQERLSAIAQDQTLDSTARSLEIVGLSGSGVKRSSKSDDSTINRLVLTRAKHSEVPESPPLPPEDLSSSHLVVRTKTRELATEPTMETLLSEEKREWISRREGSEDLGAWEDRAEAGGKSGSLEEESSREEVGQPLERKKESVEETAKYEDAHTRERTAFQQMMGRVTDEVAESYLDALGFSLNTSHSPTHFDPSRHDAIIDPIKRLLEPVPSRNRGLRRQPGLLAASLPMTSLPRSRFPALNSGPDSKTARHRDLKPGSSQESGPRGGFDHTDTYKVTETAAIRANQRLMGKKRRPMTLSNLNSTEGFPEDFVFSPGFQSSGAFSPQPELCRGLSKVEMRLQVFLYYVTNIGFPMAQQGDLCSFEPMGEILPQHVVKMGKRLNLKVSSVKFASAESDLLWIALLQLSCPIPKTWGVGDVQSRILVPFGQLPGDEYFMLMTAFNRRIRGLELVSMPKEERVASLVKDSWLCLSNIRNQKYFYNFLTGDKTHFLQLPVREGPDLSKDKRVQALKAYLVTKLAPQHTVQPRLAPSSRPSGALNLAQLLH